MRKKGLGTSAEKKATVLHLGRGTSQLQKEAKGRGHSTDGRVRVKMARGPKCKTGFKQVKKCKKSPREKDILKTRRKHKPVGKEKLSEGERKGLLCPVSWLRFGRIKGRKKNDVKKKQQGQARREFGQPRNACNVEQRKTGQKCRNMRRHGRSKLHTKKPKTRGPKGGKEKAGVCESCSPQNARRQPNQLQGRKCKSAEEEKEKDANSLKKKTFAAPATCKGVQKRNRKNPKRQSEREGPATKE